MMKKVCVYTPYDLVPGGGERYLLTAAEYFLNQKYRVFLALDEIYSRLRLKQMERDLGLSLEGLNITAYNTYKNGTKADFDIFMAMGNSIVPPVLPLGSYNIYICQFPFPQEESWIEENAANLGKYDKVIVYSNFVLNNYKKLSKKYGLPDIPIEVVYPPCGDANVNANANSANRKDKIIILTVGRFFTEGHCKRQDFLIESFIEMTDKYSLEDVELHIAGSIHPTKDGRDFFASLQKMAGGRKNIFLYGNIEAPALQELYERADIYWHAAGINVNPAEHPEMLEHFGITIVEAMSSGCIPVAINKGGPAEIVRDGIDGYCFNSKDELIEHTVKLISLLKDKSGNETIYLINHAIERSLDFTKDKFYERLAQIIPLN
jgi:glycosyltransferase involved in cell wall biosynthesis